MTLKLSPANLKAIGQLVVILDKHPRGALILALFVVLAILGFVAVVITARMAPAEPVSKAMKHTTQTRRSPGVVLVDSPSSPLVDA